MPHFIVEYSENLEKAVSIDDVLDAVHAAAMASGLAALDALRVRAEPRSNYRIADGHCDNAFLGVTIRMAPGRAPEDKHRLIDLVLNAVETSLGDAARNVMLAVEYQEVDAEFRVNKNNLRQTIAKRAEKAN